MKKICRFLGITTTLLLLSNSVVQAQEYAKDTTVVSSADEKAASFPGGIDGWRKYLENNLRYPKKAYKKNI